MGHEARPWHGIGEHVGDGHRPACTSAAQCDAAGQPRTPHRTDAAHGTSRHGTARRGMARHGAARRDTAWHSTAQDCSGMMARARDGFGHVGSRNLQRTVVAACCAERLQAGGTLLTYCCGEVMEG